MHNMACNCNSGGTSNCVQCSAGLPCNCPPDYSVLPQPVECSCCPDGYTFYGPTPNYPSGYCQNSTGSIVGTIPCNSCVDSVSSDCVFLPDIECFGIKGPYPLTAFVEYLCSEAFVLKQLQTIGLSTTLKAALCQIVSVCPVVGSTTPIPGPIIVTVP
jgi:hypothetical protein